MPMHEGDVIVNVVFPVIFVISYFLCWKVKHKKCLCFTPKFARSNKPKNKREKSQVNSAASVKWWVIYGIMSGSKQTAGGFWLMLPPILRGAQGDLGSNPHIFWFPPENLPRQAPSAARAGELPEAEETRCQKTPHRVAVNHSEESNVQLKVMLKCWCVSQSERKQTLCVGWTLKRNADVGMANAVPMGGWVRQIWLVSISTLH